MLCSTIEQDGVSALALTMEALYIELRGEDVLLRLSTQSANNFSPRLSVTANSPASWLPYTFVNSEVVLWVSDGRPLLPTAAYASDYSGLGHQILYFLLDV